MTAKEKAEAVFDAMSVIKSVEAPCPLCIGNRYVVWEQLTTGEWRAKCGHRYAAYKGYYVP